MKTALLVPIAALASLIVLAPGPTRAANAEHPYQNIDPRNDKGNDTGDPQVDRLNQAQLDTNGRPTSPQYTAPVAPPTAPPGGQVIIVPRQQ